MKLEVGDPRTYECEVYIDGEKCDLCVYADEENGIAIMYVIDYSKHIKKYKNSIFKLVFNEYSNVGRPGDIMTIVTGKVEIKGFKG